MLYTEEHFKCQTIKGKSYEKKFAEFKRNTQPSI